MALRREAVREAGQRSRDYSSSILTDAAVGRRGVQFVRDLHDVPRALPRLIA